MIWNLSGHRNMFIKPQTFHRLQSVSIYLYTFYFLSIDFAGADSRRCQERHSGTECQANYQTANVGLASIRVLGLRRLPSLSPSDLLERAVMLFINTSPPDYWGRRSGQLRKARMTSSLQMQRRRSRSQMASQTRLSIFVIAWHGVKDTRCPAI